VINLTNQANGKTALITGGSRGIGRGIAYAMASEGYDVAISHYNDHDNAAEVHRTIITKYHRKCIVIEGDLRQESEPARLTDETLRHFQQIDVLVNNAGVTIFRDMVEMELEQMNTLIQLDFRAPLLLMQNVGRHMIEQGVKGSIINITSTRAERAYPGDAVYGGMKAGLARAVESIALEYSAYGIRVNCIAPGAISTTKEREGYFNELGRKIPLNRPGTPEDIGHAAVWLASDQSSYITGATIRVDGGLILPGMPETVGKESDIGWRRKG
jgi:glucose 1-dehydrogenase